MPEHVTIVEVGPRDGLQNEPVPIPTSAKVDFIDALAAAGVTTIEATSFVNPKAVPQLADAAETMLAIARPPDVRYLALVPNEKGLERAIAARLDAIAIFTAATEAFCQANIRCSIDESFARFIPVMTAAAAAGIPVRGYVSVAFACPYAGAVDPAAAVEVGHRLLDIGCYEVCYADTIGVATIDGVRALLAASHGVVPLERTALHFHDTHGQAVANVEAALALGVRVFDAAAGGLGGCPFAPGAPGNVATEAVVRRLDALGWHTGIDADAVAAAAAAIRPLLTRQREA